MSRHVHKWATEILISAHEKFRIGAHLPIYVKDLMGETYSNLTKVITDNKQYTLQWFYFGIAPSSNETEYQTWEEVPELYNTKLILVVKECE